ncbi:MAG: hypothetical protein AB7V56_13810 [Candidatus Nitrosocosmicus sp.]
MNSTYWTYTDSSRYERKFHEYIDDRYKQIFYYDKELGRNIKFNSGGIYKHDFYESHGSIFGHRKQAAPNTYETLKTDSNTANINCGPVLQREERRSQNIGLILKGKSEEFQRAVDYISKIDMYIESTDFRLKKIEQNKSWNQKSLEPRYQILKEITTHPFFSKTSKKEGAFPQDFEKEIEFTRLRQMSTKYPKIQGVSE